MEQGFDDLSALNIRALVRYVSTRWWFIVIVVLLGSICGLVVSELKTPLYLSSATLYVTASGDESASSAYQGSLASKQRVDSYTRLVTTDAVVARALNLSGLDVSVGEARSMLSASASADTVLLTIDSRDSSAARAAQLANATAQAMIEYVARLEVPAGGGTPLAKLTVVSPATVSDSPVSPVLYRYLAFGSILGLLAGVLLIYVGYRLDSRITEESNVERITARPIMGRLPLDKTLSTSTLDFSSGHSSSLEAFRKLRTNLDFASLDSTVRTILITSPSAGEGKTTTAINLALAFVEAGKSAIVVDCDLRRPAVGEKLGLSTTLGVTDYLRVGAPLDQLIQKLPGSGLDILTSGTLPPNPSEVLGSDAAHGLFDELSSMYDFVVVDAPPLLPVSDAIVLGRSMDGVLIVVRLMSTTRPDLTDAVRELTAVNVRILGSVIVDSSAYSSLYHYSGYGSYASSSPPGIAE